MTGPFWRVRREQARYPENALGLLCYARHYPMLLESCLVATLIPLAQPGPAANIGDRVRHGQDAIYSLDFQEAKGSSLS